EPFPFCKSIFRVGRGTPTSVFTEGQVIACGQNAAPGSIRHPCRLAKRIPKYQPLQQNLPPALRSSTNSLLLVIADTKQKGRLAPRDGLCAKQFLYKLDSISKPQAWSNGSGMYFEFLLRRAHSRRRVERWN